MGFQWQIQGIQLCKCTSLQKIQKTKFLAIFEGFWSYQRVSVCHTTNNALVTLTRWPWTPTTPYNQGLHKNTPPHLLWHFKVTHQENPSGSIRVILAMQVRGQQLILLLKLNDCAEWDQFDAESNHLHLVWSFSFSRMEGKGRGLYNPTSFDCILNSRIYMSDYPCHNY